jgi:plastocyanin
VSSIYYLEVYSGSLGQVNRYDLSLVAEPRVGTISGFAYDDINGDGFRQESEPGRAGVTIRLDIGDDGIDEDSVVTDANGFYEFADRPYEIYALRQDQPADRRRTWPEEVESFKYVVTLDRDTTLIDHLDFGSQQLGKITVAKDAVPDDSQDFAYTSTELGAFDLDDDGSESTVGGGLPSFLEFDLLVPGTYLVTETAISGWDLTGLVINDPDNGSSINLTTGVATIELDAGEQITVAYTNTKRGSIQVVKNALPNDGTDFSFTSDIPSNTSFQLDDDSDPALPDLLTFGNLVPGTYTITEAALGGWKLTELAFSEDKLTNSTSDIPNGVATIVVDPGETVTVTFTNTKLSSITVVKDAIPDDAADFSFTTAITGHMSFVLDDDSDPTNLNTHAIGELLPDTYLITEAALSGWDLTALVINDPDNGSSIDLAAGVATVDVDAGEDITVTYTNTKRGSITVVKNAIPDGDTDFMFTSTIPDNLAFSLDDDSDPALSNTVTFSNLVPTTYTITEAALGGWSLTGLVITEDKVMNSTQDMANGIATITVDPGESVTVAYTNTKLGAITVVKDAIPDDSADFTFTSLITGHTSFMLDDDSDPTLSNSRVISGLLPGSYAITEAALAGWDLTALVINDPDNGSSVNLTTRVATIDVDAGEAITVTFTNTKRGSITVVKDAIPNDGADFSFTSDIPSNTNFQLDDDSDPVLPNLRAFGDLVPGTYTITEAALSGWKLDDLVISEDKLANSTRDIPNGVATIMVDPGESVTVTFTNTKLGRISVTKVSLPDDPQDFSFTTMGAGLEAFTLDDDGVLNNPWSDSRLFTDLAPGSYTITETAVSNWDLTDLVISDPDNGSSVNKVAGFVTIDLDPGEQIVVTFTNTKRGSITVAKDAIPDNPADFSFSSTISGNGSFVLDDDGGIDASFPNTRTFGGLLPGSYTVTEASLGGWSLTNLVISEDKLVNSSTDLGARVATIVVDPGETVTVTYTNTKLGKITIVKDTQPDASQDFTFDFTRPPGGVPASESFDLDDDLDATLSNTKVYSDLAPGLYTIGEQLTPGWTLDSIAVINDATNDSSSDVANRNAMINVGAGEEITVTFVNLATPLVQGVKFRDDNANGSRQLGEPGLAGFLMELYRDDGDGVFEPMESIGNVVFPGQDTLVGTATTDAFGAYKLGVLSDAVAGQRFFIRERQQAGFRETTAGLRNAVYAGGFTPLPNQDFGNFSCTVDFDLSTVDAITPVNEGILTLQLEGGGTFTVTRSDGQAFNAYDPTNTQTNLFFGNTVASRSIDTLGATARADIRITVADVIANTDSNPSNDVRFLVSVIGAPANARLRSLNAVNVLTSTSVFLQVRGTACGELIAIRDDADATGASDAKRIAIGSVYGPLNNGAQPLTFEGIQYKATIINPLFGGNPAIAGIQVFAGGGDDIVRVGSGTTARDITLQQSTIYLGEGNDFARVGGQRATIFGDQGDDLVIGGAADDTIYGGFGNDRLFGSGGPDRIFGDDGNDLIGGGDGNDSQLFGGLGNDTISGGRGNDRISGDAGIDTAYRDNFDTAGVTTCETVNSLGVLSEAPQVDGVLRNLIDAVFDDLELSDGDEDPAIADTIDELLNAM